jgi:anti-sigma B factor antagonist
MTSSSADEPGHPTGADEVLVIDFSLRLSGRLDAATVGRFEKAIRTALESSPREIVVDLTGVDFIDPTGQTALLKAHLRSRQRGLPIKFVPSDHEAVKQLVAVTGSDEISD